MWCNEQTNNKLKMLLVGMISICALIFAIGSVYQYARRPIEEIQKIEEIRMNKMRECSKMGGKWDREGDCWNHN